METLAKPTTPLPSWVLLDSPRLLPRSGECSTSDAMLVRELILPLALLILLIVAFGFVNTRLTQSKNKGAFIQGTSNAL